jgi:hypothetical protein
LSDPTAERGSGAGNSFDARYPTGMTPKIYTKIDFYEYRRDISNRGLRTQTGSIRLPTPEQFDDTSGIRLSGDGVEMGVIGGIADYIAKGGSLDSATIDAGRAIDQFKNQFGVNSPQTAALALARLIPGGSDGSAASAVAATFTGVVPNPHVTLLFEGVSLKTFDFQWRLSPRSQQDATAINSIIRTIKARMHPGTMKIGGTSYALLYPDLVKVKIVGSNGIEASEFAFIESFKVAFSGSGNSMAFYKDGQPVEAMLSLRIKEIDIRTRENFDGSQGQSVALDAGIVNPNRELP